MIAHDTFYSTLYLNVDLSFFSKNDHIGYKSIYLNILHEDNLINKYGRR